MRIISLLSLFLVFGVICLQQSFATSSMTNELEASQSQAYWLLTVQLNVYSIEMKTETLCTSYSDIALWSLDNASSIRGAIFKSDKGGSFIFFTGPIEGTERQRFLDEIKTDPTKATPWEWKLCPMQRFLGLSSPFDQYELSILITLNETIKLEHNYTNFLVPTNLRGEWEFTEHLERISEVPTNSTLQSHGIDPKTFAFYDGNEMIDFYLYTVTIKPLSTYILRMFIAFLFPPIIIFILLIFVAFRRKRLSRSDFLTVYLATAFFILPFLVSFYQFAPPRAFTWQEVLFFLDFCFATFLVYYAILKKDDSNKNQKRI